MDMFDARSARPMLIAGEADAFDDPDWLFELKLDGERCLAYLDAGGTELVNKRGKRVLAKFPELSGLHERVNGRRCILDGELITGQGGMPDFEAIKRRSLMSSAAAIKREASRTPAVFLAFDVLYVGNEPVVSRPLTERKAILDELAQPSESLALSLVVEERGKALQALTQERGLEGVVGKRKQSLYLPGKRSAYWVKIKNWLEDDFVVCGYLPSEGAVVSVILGQYDGRGGLLYTGRALLGKARGDFAEIAGRPPVAGHPFAAAPPRETREAVWLAPDLVCTVSYMCRTAIGGLRQPHYKSLRFDKTPAECREPVPGARQNLRCVD